MPSLLCSRCAICCVMLDEHDLTGTISTQTGNEASVDRLMKQISAFMSEISDEFKVIVVNAIRALCLKFPAKQSVMLTFLSGVLRDEGGYDFKKSVVEAIFDMVKFISDSKEAGMSLFFTLIFWDTPDML